MLSFIGQQESRFDCTQLRLAMSKAEHQTETIAICLEECESVVMRKNNKSLV
ncbi:MAG TPA: hypothetical protein ACHBX0_12720 [Arsenophonus sp.]